MWREEKGGTAGVFGKKTHERNTAYAFYLAQYPGTRVPGNGVRLVN